MKLSPERAALVVVDMQVGFFSPDSAMAKIGFDLGRLHAAVAPCVSAVEIARASGVPIIFTRYVFAEDHSDGGVMVELVPGLRDHRALVAGEWEVEILPELTPHDGDIVIDKNRPSAFFGTTLDTILKERGISRLIVCGVTTNCCVEGTVRDASARDLETFVIAEATAETDPDRHDNALKAMGMLFAKLVTLDDLAEAFA